MVPSTEVDKREMKSAGIDRIGIAGGLVWRAKKDKPTHFYLIIRMAQAESRGQEKKAGEIDHLSG